MTGSAAAERYHCGTHLNTKPQKVFDRPKEYIDIDKPNKPSNMTGRRPTMSLSLDQFRTVNACVACKSHVLIFWFQLSYLRGKEQRLHHADIVPNSSLVAVGDTQIPDQLGGEGVDHLHTHATISISMRNKMACLSDLAGERLCKL